MLRRGKRASVENTRGRKRAEAAFAAINIVEGLITSRVGLIASRQLQLSAATTCDYALSCLSARRIRSIFTQEVLFPFRCNTSSTQNKINSKQQALIYSLTLALIWPWTCFFELLEQTLSSSPRRHACSGSVLRDDAQLRSGSCS